jgi:hypothetical protein
MLTCAWIASGCCAAPDDVFALPANPVPDRGASGVGPFDDGATCATGDGCFDCPLLDADCADGATCPADGLCTSACFEPDPDCARADDGLPCTFGEECAGFQCVAVDGNGTCASACVDGTCSDGFTCVDDVCVAPACA